MMMTTMGTGVVRVTWGVKVRPSASVLTHSSGKRLSSSSRSPSPPALQSVPQPVSGPVRGHSPGISDLFSITTVISFLSMVTCHRANNSLRKNNSIVAFIMMPVMINMIMRSLFVSGQNCFGGIETFEKVSMTDFDETFSPAGILLQQTDTALTRDCINLCKQQPSCLSFGLDYTRFRCAAYSINSIGRKANLISTNTTNFFEKVCYRGLTREEYEKVCGIERLWSFERVEGAFLDGFEKLQLNNVASRAECAKACLMENSFACRSADYDEVLRICRLSKDDRRTQPQAFRLVPGSSREYIENQCSSSGPSTCLYETKRDVGVVTMDSLVFASNTEDCQFKCDKEHTFNCRSYSVEDKRCFLSGDDRVSLSLGQPSSTIMPVKYGSLYGEKKCVTEHCRNGIFTYEKITGYAMRTAVTNSIRIRNVGSLGITQECREACDESSVQCPAFTINYQTSRCEKLDRNTNGKTMDLNPVEGESIFEKVCLRIPDITNSMCRDKFWAFERVIGHEMSPAVYRKTYNFVQSRRDCQEYCLQEKEFTCRSALYSEETTDCKLTPEDRRTMPHAFARNNNVKVSYLENQCIREHSHCPFVEVHNGYPTYTDIVMREDVTNTHSCQKMCNENRRFLCRSFAFYSSNSQCFLSGDDRSSAGTTATQSRPGMTYYERVCDTASSLNGSATHNNRDEEMESHGLSDGNREPTAVEPPHSQPIDSSSESSPDVPSVRPSASTTETPPDSAPALPSMSSFPSGSSFPAPVPTAKSRDVDGLLIRPFPLKCGPNSRFTFERVPNFEPVGGYLNLLYTDNNNPGIVSECTDRCLSNVRCRAFIIDYTAGSCFGIFDNSSIGKFDLRLAIGKDYFEGFCAPNHLTCGKLWHFDRIVDQATTGAQAKHVIRYISKTDCKIRCLEEWRFPCAAVSFDGHLNECKLYDADRHSGQLALTFTKGIDYMENQCSFTGRTCIFMPYERDVAMVSITRSIRGSSSFLCEQQCSSSADFNCRSFTYVEQTSIPGANLCLLSSDSKKSSQKGSSSHRPRALYGERDCTGQYGPTRPQAAAAGAMGREGRIQYDGGVMRQSDRTYGGSRNPYYNSYGGYPLGSGSAAGAMGGAGISSYPSSGSSGYPAVSGSSSPYGGSSAMYPSQGSMSLYGGSRYPSTSISSSGSVSGGSGMYGHIAPVPSGGYGMPNSYPYPNSLYSMPSYTHSPQSGSPTPVLHSPSLPYGSSVEFEKAGDDGDYSCGYHQYTFEKTFGYDMRYARKDRSRIPSRQGLAIQCQDECLRRRFKCNAFVIEYGAVQSCYFLEESAGEARKVLQKVPEVAYFEKVCLKERSCGKLWTFERVIGFDFEETAEKEIPAVPTRTQCQDYCLGEKTFSCKSATYNYKAKTCKLFTETRRSRPQLFKSASEDIDYLENHCAKEPPTCQYKDHNDMFFPFVDRLTNAFSLSDCQRQCDGERLFSCRAVAYETFARECALYSEDTTSVKAVIGTHYQPVTTTPSPADLLTSSSTSTAFPIEHIPLFGRQAILQQRRHTVYSEKGSCEQVSVQCTQQDMLLTMNFDSPFSGRVYAKGNPSQCYVLGTGSTQLQFAISLGSKCGTRPEGEKNFANEVVIQQHPVIMTDSDRTIRVLCTFDSIDQTVTLMSPNSEKPGIDVHKKSYLYSNDNVPMLDSSVPAARTRVEMSVPSVVANSAPPPSVIMRILDRTGTDASVVGLGDELTLQIELRDPSSAFGLFARNLYARSSNGESLFLLDNTGCPTDPIIFPALHLNPMGSKALSSTFKAFRFPSSGIVNFEVQVRFCQDKCEPIKCPGSANSYAMTESYGRRRRRRRSPELIEVVGTSSNTATTTSDQKTDDPALEDEYSTITPGTEIPSAADSVSLPQNGADSSISSENGSMTDEWTDVTHSSSSHRALLLSRSEGEADLRKDVEIGSDKEVRQTSSGDVLMHAPRAEKWMMSNDSIPQSSAAVAASPASSGSLSLTEGVSGQAAMAQPLTDGPYSYPQQNYMSSYTAPPPLGLQRQQQMDPNGHYAHPYGGNVAGNNNYYPASGPSSSPHHTPLQQQQHQQQSSASSPLSSAAYPPFGQVFGGPPVNSPYSPYQHNSQVQSGISSPWNLQPQLPQTPPAYLPHDHNRRFSLSNDSGWPFFSSSGSSGSPALGSSRLSLPVPSGGPSSASSPSASSPSVTQVDKPILVHSSRPLPSTDKAKFRPPRPLSRPKDPQRAGSTISSTDTLRTTIVVGDESDGVPDSGSGNQWSDKRSTSSGKTAHGTCNTGPAILYTAIIVTLLHVGIILGAYFYYRRFLFTYSSSKSLKLFSAPSFSTENIAIASSGLKSSSGAPTARDFYSSYHHLNHSDASNIGSTAGRGGPHDAHHHHSSNESAGHQHASGVLSHHRPPNERKAGTSVEADKANAGAGKTTGINVSGSGIAGTASNYHLLNTAASSNNSNVFYGTGNVTQSTRQQHSSSSSAAAVTGASGASGSGTGGMTRLPLHNNRTIFNNNKNAGGNQESMSGTEEHNNINSRNTSGRTFTEFYSGIYGSPSP